jgi:hypothetical protein
VGKRVKSHPYYNQENKISDHKTDVKEHHDNWANVLQPKIKQRTTACRARETTNPTQKKAMKKVYRDCFTL